PGMDHEPMRTLPALALLFFASAATLVAAKTNPFDVRVRGKVIPVQVYPAAADQEPKGTIFMGSGDAGWIGLGVELAEDLSRDGYTVVGINVRRYLQAFRVGKDHLTTTDVPNDYAEVERFLVEQKAIAPPVIMAGVSEGAALAVLAASSQANHAWIRGVIT